MARFKHTDNSQGMFLTVNLSEQLLPGTFEWTLNYLIDRMDLSLFEQNYNNDDMGAKAYPPKALLKIIIYCYSLGILSSRPMEKACRTNMAVNIQWQLYCIVYNVGKCRGALINGRQAGGHR